MKIDPVHGFVIGVCLTFCVTAGPITYNVVDLGTLGGSSATANAVNASGQTTGTRVNTQGIPHAFSSSSDLTPAGSEGAIASGINRFGVVTGTTYANGTTYATVWTGTLAEYLSADAYAMGINDSGQVTGMALDGQGFGHAFLNTAGVMTDLGVLPGGDWSSGYGISASGQVAGYGSTASGNFRGFIWSGTTGMTSIGTLGGRNSYALAINDSGQVAGAAQTRSGSLHAVITFGSGLLDLGTFGGSSSFAYGISPDGTVVGYSATGLDEMHAFVYTNGQMYDLNSLLVEATGWELTAAYGINSSGQISGTGRFNGVEHAILLDPAFEMTPRIEPGTLSLSPVNHVPEPATVTLIIGGLALVGARQLRRRTL